MALALALCVGCAQQPPITVAISWRAPHESADARVFRARLTKLGVYGEVFAAEGLTTLRLFGVDDWPAVRRELYRRGHFTVHRLAVLPEPPLEGAVRRGGGWETARGARESVAVRLEPLQDIPGLMGAISCDADGSCRGLVLEAQPVLASGMVAEAQVVDVEGSAAVRVTLTGEGQRAYGAATRSSVGRTFVFVEDGEVHRRARLGSPSRGIGFDLEGLGGRAAGVAARLASGPLSRDYR